jgi:hypothetical protein
VALFRHGAGCRVTVPLAPSGAGCHGFGFEPVPRRHRRIHTGSKPNPWHPKPAVGTSFPGPPMPRSVRSAPGLR